MEKKELSWGRVFILIGALMAFLIGSGFASGQETVQYFTGYGVVGGFLVGTFNFVMIYIAYVHRLRCIRIRRTHPQSAQPQ